mmetsp:Transcript_5655/g.7029  ORF Transcript_5655/g.7029 Transcript_5655/m.7029 type:complete len:397 (-) Transcript_5655:144-1334(-)
MTKTELEVSENTFELTFPFQGHNVPLGISVSMRVQNIDGMQTKHAVVSANPDSYDCKIGDMILACNGEYIGENNPNPLKSLSKSIKQIREAKGDVILMFHRGLAPSLFTPPPKTKRSKLVGLKEKVKARVAIKKLNFSSPPSSPRLNVIKEGKTIEENVVTGDVEINENESTQPPIITHCDTQDLKETLELETELSSKIGSEENNSIILINSSNLMEVNKEGFYNHQDHISIIKKKNEDMIVHVKEKNNDTVNLKNENNTDYEKEIEKQIKETKLKLLETFSKELDFIFEEHKSKAMTQTNYLKLQANIVDPLINKLDIISNQEIPSISSQTNKSFPHRTETETKMEMNIKTNTATDTSMNPSENSLYNQTLSTSLLLSISGFAILGFILFKGYGK